MNLGLSVHFKEIKSNPSLMLKDSLDNVNNQKTSEVEEFNSQQLVKEFINKKRERDEIKVNDASLKLPNELSLEKKTLIDTILKSKAPLFAIKQPVITNKGPFIQSSTLAIVNKVIQKENKGNQLILPKTQSKLSQKALQVIEELNKERKNRFERTTKTQSYQHRSESSFSLRLRNEELINEERQLPLPLKFKRVMNTFIALDNSINFFKQHKSQSIISFNTLKEAIETTEKHRFTMETFQQILYVVPHFYVLKWIRNNSTNDYELLIDIPNDYDKRLKEIETIEGRQTDLRQFDFNKLQAEFKKINGSLKQKEINDRRKVFKNILLEIVNEEHKQFLLNNQTDYAPHLFDPFKLKTWHNAFELDRIKDIPQFSIESKPVNFINKYEQCIKDNDIKHILIEKAFYSITSEKDKATVATDVDIEINNFNRNISIDLLKRIKMKEDAIKISKEIIDLSIQKHSEQDSTWMLKEIAIAVSNLFITKESIAFDELIDGLNRSICQCDLKPKIVLLIRMFPKWIKVVKHSSLGNVVILDKSINIYEQVINKIQ